MQALTRKRAFGIGWRARVPLIARIVAFTLLASGIAVVAVSYYKLRNVEKFRAKSAQPELSKQVTGVIEGYSQQMTKDGRLYMMVKASRDITFDDGHHELENVSMAVYPDEGQAPNQISAARAIYQPNTNVISFVGNVKIDTKENLHVATESLSFDQTTGLAHTDAALAFNRDNVSGTATGALVEQKAKRLELKQNVAIKVEPQATNATTKSSARAARHDSLGARNL